MNITNKTLIKEVIIPKDTANIWSQWSTHEGLKTFFGYDNKIELKVGGSFEIYFIEEAPYGSKGSENCKIIGYVPERLISFTWNSPPIFKEIRDSLYHTFVTVELELLEPNLTKVTLKHAGWPEGSQWNQVYEYFDAAWERVFENLKNSN